MAATAKKPKLRNMPFLVKTWRVVDGDTVEAVLDYGKKLYHTQSIRLAGVDAPEVHGSTGALGHTVATAVRGWLGKHEPLVLMSESWDEKYGRLVGDFCQWDFVLGEFVKTEWLTDYLLTAKLVRPYRGEKRQAWTEEELAPIRAFKS